jgi:hypothetical protein
MFLSGRRMISSRSGGGVSGWTMAAVVLLTLLSSLLADARLSNPNSGQAGEAITGAGAGVYLPSEVHPDRARDLHIMIMTHNRPASVERLIDQVVSLAKTRKHRLHFVVSQSASGPEAENVASLRKTLASVRAKHSGESDGLLSLAHVLAPYIRSDESFSVNRKAHGSKRNSVYNMLVGLDVAFTGTHKQPGFNHPYEVSDDDFAASLSEGMDKQAASAAGGADGKGYSALKELDSYRRHLQSSGFLAGVKARTQNGGGGDADRKRKRSASFPDPPPLNAAAANAAADGSDVPIRKEGILADHPMVITLEDDILLSPDALDYFSFAQDLMASEQTDPAAALAAFGKPDAAVPAAAPYLSTVEEATASNNVGGVDGEIRGSERDNDEPVTPLGDGALHFATAYSLFRPSLLVGQDDVAYIRRRHEKEGIFSTVTDRLLGSPRSVFKTLAWSCDALGYSKLRALLASVVTYEPSPWRSRVEATVREANEVAAALRSKAAGFLESEVEATIDEVSSTARFLTFRSGHPEFAPTPAAGGSSAVSTKSRRTGRTEGKEQPAPWSCWWCNDYCYDHSIEWLLQRQPFLAPALPRVTQQQGSGMTSVSNDQNEHYQGASPLIAAVGGKGSEGLGASAAAAGGDKAEAVAEALAIAAIPPHELAERYGYHLREWPLYWTTSLLFRTPGLSAISPPLPDEVKSEEIAGSTSPVLQLERTVRELREKTGLLDRTSASGATTSFSGDAAQPDERVIRPLLDQALFHLKELQAVPSSEVLVLYGRERLLLFGVFPLALIIVLVLVTRVFLPSLSTFFERKRYQDLISESKRKGVAPVMSTVLGSAGGGAGGGRRGSFGAASASSGSGSGGKPSSGSASGAFLLESGGVAAARKATGISAKED